MQKTFQNQKNKIMIWHAIGLMSGTSLDGLDICYSKFTLKNNHWDFEILIAETIPYPKTWEDNLKNAISLPSEKLLELNSEYGFYLGDKVQEFITKHNLIAIDVIASHGHTVFHQPEKKFTLQIGDGRAIKIKTQLPVIYDFRSEDVLMGGNGAPLVPIGDHLLFSNYDACINIGGFSNISLEYKKQRIAFDICPVNIILNKYAQNLGKNYDDKGNLAKKGNISSNLLNTLNNLDFYTLSHPKSLGIEWCKENIFPLLENIPDLDILATFTEHAAIQISNVINTYSLNNILFTGGGSYNEFLIERIKTKVKGQIIIPNSKIIDFKEALIFSFMGILKLNGQNNILASATGSPKDHSSGIIA